MEYVNVLSIDSVAHASQKTSILKKKMHRMIDMADQSRNKEKKTKNKYLYFVLNETFNFSGKICIVNIFSSYTQLCALIIASNKKGEKSETIITKNAILISFESIPYCDGEINDNKKN